MGTDATIQVTNLPSIKSMKLPRKHDLTLVEIFLAENYTGTNLRRLNRCRLALKAIFLSDIVTASGRRLEEFALDSRVGRESCFKFPREHPTSADWKLWDEFWTSWRLPNGTLPVTLGEWIEPSHQVWKWQYDDSTGALWEKDNTTWVEYMAVNTGRSTRGSMRYSPVRTWETLPGTGVPATVNRIGGEIHLLELGTAQPHQHSSDQLPESFWEFVTSQGGDWIWDYIEGKHENMSWIATALYDGSAIMVTDGSYNRVRAPNISGAGWVLVSTKSLKMVYGSFYELSKCASSYRGELLGLTAIHHLVAFVLEFYVVRSANGSIHCDNKGALHQAATKRKRVRPRTKHADLIRNLRHIKATHQFEVLYHHVKAHLDDHMAFDQLTVVQQLNVHCDLLAKQAVQDYITNPSDRATVLQLLPREQAAVFVAGEKQTSDTANALRFALGMIKAKRFFTRPVQIKNGSNKGGLGWQGKRFDAIDWDTLERVLASKPTSFGIWLAKQTVGVCATRRIMARNLGLSDDRCPNCLRGPERSSHLNHCLDDGRSLLFTEAVEDLNEWMAKNQRTDAELRYWLIKFLLFRGERSMSSLGDMSPAVKTVASGIDSIGWDDLLHGRIPISLLTFQHSYCASLGNRMNGADWAKAFVIKLLDISHGQWMYRNFSLHNKNRGHLQLSHQAEVLSEIAILAESRPEDIPPESRFLLELETATLDLQSLARQEYWVAAMKAALKAGRRCGQGRAQAAAPVRRCQAASAVETASHRRNLHLFRRRLATLERTLREDLDLDQGSWRN